MCRFQLGEATVARDIEIPGVSLVEETTSRCGELVQTGGYQHYDPHALHPACGDDILCAAGDR